MPLYKWLHCIHDQFPVMLHVYKSHFDFQVKCSAPIREKKKRVLVKVLLTKKKRVLHKPERKSFAYRWVSCLSSGLLLLCRLRGLVIFGFFCRNKNQGVLSQSAWPLISVNIPKRYWLCCVGAETLFCLAVGSTSVGFCGTCVTGGFWEMLSFTGFSTLG